MGFFSWKTCDSKESIPNSYSIRPVRPVFLLQPHGKQPLRENAYEGYGVFGGVDAYIWLAKTNLDRNCGLSDEAMRFIGVRLGCGFDFYRDSSKEVYTTSEGAKVIEARGMFDFPVILFENGKKFTVDGESATSVEHVKKRRLIRQTPPSVAYPLKFSFNEHARYEAHPASDMCDHQGFLYDE